MKIPNETFLFVSSFLFELVPVKGNLQELDQQ